MVFSKFPGSNHCFCAGADLKAFSAQHNTNQLDEMSAQGPMGPSRLLLSKPVIAAIAGMAYWVLIQCYTHTLLGYAVAGGLELACWCDLRVAHKDSIMVCYYKRNIVINHRVCFVEELVYH